MLTIFKKFRFSVPLLTKFAEQNNSQANKIGPLNSVLKSPFRNKASSKKKSNGKKNYEQFFFSLVAFLKPAQLW